MCNTIARQQGGIDIGCRESRVSFFWAIEEGGKASVQNHVFFLVAAGDCLHSFRFMLDVAVFFGNNVPRT